MVTAFLISCHCCCDGDRFSDFGSEDYGFDSDFLLGKNKKRRKVCHRGVSAEIVPWDCEWDEESIVRPLVMESQGHQSEMRMERRGIPPPRCERSKLLNFHCANINYTLTTCPQ